MACGQGCKALPLYRRFFGDAWDSLPPPIRTMHDGDGTARGLAVVERGRNPLARLLAVIIGLPKAGTDVPVEVAFRTQGARELWQRRFAGKPFRSVQFEGRGHSAGLIRERFGPATIDLTMVIDGETLRLIVRRWSFLGIPLPRFLAPRGDNHECVQDSRFRFHVEIGFPVIGLIVRYRGWLVRERPQAPS